MAIFIDEKNGLFTLHTERSTYQMKVGPFGIFLHLYYGAKAENTDFSYRLQMIDRGFSGNPYQADNDRTISLDSLPLEYPAAGTGDFRESCLAVIQADGSRAADLRYQSHRLFSGKKPELPGLPSVYHDDCQTLEVTLKDTSTQLTVTLCYSVIEKLDVITRSARIVNGNKAAVTLDRALSCCLDFPEHPYDLMTFHGKHAMERIPERTPLRYGTTSVDSVRGASSHQQNPFVILCGRDTSEEQGDCYGVAFVYSGNFLAGAQVDQIGQTRLYMGLNPENFSWQLEPGDTFTVPEAVLCFSDQGLSRLSHKLHRLIREHVCRGEYQLARRPVLINNWEATYFDFDEQKLLTIAKNAAELGIDMLVMDDGWFGSRNGDQSGLGDWTVNEQKLKGGLRSLVERVNALGLSFGIWFEPEMVSEDSDLYRAHPDWALAIPGREPGRSRYQLVLDMSRPEGVEYLYQSMEAVLTSANIQYVKWDMNRHLSDVWSSAVPAGRQGEISHRYVLGLYSLLDRLLKRFPNVLFEGCSGGGGRFDLGMLCYTPQIWCSDNTDAIDRISIQYGTSFCYPASTVGSHVSVCPNHQTGRTTPLSTRGVVAMAGTFGYELDISKMSVEEKEEVRRQVAFIKEHASLIAQGEDDRLTNPLENHRYAAWQFVSRDQRQALVCFVLLQATCNPEPLLLRVRGLEPGRMYAVNGQGNYSGSALMHGGIPVPFLYEDFASLTFEIQAIS